MASGWNPSHLTSSAISQPLICLFIFGSEGTAGAGIAAGVPQLVCAIDVEKELNGKALTKAGIGKFIPIYDPAVSLNEQMITALLADSGAADCARKVAAAHYAQYSQADPLADFEAACVRLLE